ncbi:MAG: hypothetical protein Q7R40_02805 [Phaeospirillum sp.]|nr:hypothetical protein [Phaeospirillum sp.]
MAKRTPLAPEVLSDDTKKFFAVLNGSSDLSVILIAASYLDACLAALLHKFFIKSKISDELLEFGGGALGGFQARADVAYALALVNKPIYRDLKKIAEIRNKVAHHHLEVGFDAGEIEPLCNSLDGFKMFDNILNPPKTVEMWSSPRNKFVLTVVMMSQKLILGALGVQRCGQAKKETVECAPRPSPAP